MTLLLWLTASLFLSMNVLLFLRFTRALQPTPSGHALARQLGLAGPHSVVLLVGSLNALWLTAPHEFKFAATPAVALWSAGAALLLLLTVLAGFGLSAWAQDRHA